MYYAQEVPLPATLEKPNHQTINDLKTTKAHERDDHRMEQSFRYFRDVYGGQEWRQKIIDVNFVPTLNVGRTFCFIGKGNISGLGKC